MKLLLFDIDGTLLVTNGAGRTSIQRILSEICQRPISTNPVSFSGKTDPQIMRELMTAHDMTPDEIDACMDEALQAYADLLPTNLSQDRIEIMPGAVELVEYLATRDDVVLGLITGNLEVTAYLKLQAIGLDHHFDFGAFGSDASDRNALPPIALERAHAHSGRSFYGPDVVVIGDTEHDIRCTRVVEGFAVAVCTGHFSREELAPHKPDVLLDDLSDHDLFLKHVFPAAA